MTMVRARPRDANINAASTTLSFDHCILYFIHTHWETKLQFERVGFFSFAHASSSAELVTLVCFHRGLEKYTSISPTLVVVVGDVPLRSQLRHPRPESERLVDRRRRRRSSSVPTTTPTSRNRNVLSIVGVEEGAGMTGGGQRARRSMASAGAGEDQNEMEGVGGGGLRRMGWSFVGAAAVSEGEGPRPSPIGTRASDSWRGRTSSGPRRR